ncbi:CRO1 protein [Lepidopterella palustris CBS 459.81]|uniref:CRO1 protein n=1 Tax=Lepidopterella palustris CBS 459.81 TaxID=1314670 RepID=A0A8E2EM17_9PEZI|nr:CRO1 protein [Lepidopterella palustris CBS 459.81]
MATTIEEGRVEQLTQSAAASVRAGKFVDAALALREATTIAPENPRVKAAWINLKEEESKSPLLDICKAWVKSKDENDGEDALKLIKGHQLTDEVAEQAMSILMDYKGECDTLDHVTGELLKIRSAQNILATYLRDHPTETYYEIFERGDDSMDGMLQVLLNRAAWPSDAAFIQAHRDAFMLSLAMMMEEALDHPERAMKGIARLLAAHASHLNGIIDSDSFDVILSALDIRLPSSLRSQATLATVKLLELAPDTAQNLISKFVTSRVAVPTTDGLIVAFSAAASIFPITTSVAAALFLTEGFVSGLVPLVQNKKSQKLEQASLELISAACVDKTCREAIGRHCRLWLEDIVEAGTDKRRSNLAALILMKLGEEQPSDQVPQIIGPAKVDQDDLISRFKTMVLSSETSSKQDSVEGLAYASLQPKVREQLANDHPFLLRLIETMADPAAAKPVIFGGLTIFVNLTTYLPVQSEEEKRMAQLKAYANTTKPTEPDPLENSFHVTARCKKVLDSGIVPLLVSCSKRASPSVLSQMLQILLSLSQEQKHRGIMAQQGAVKLILHIWVHIHAEEHPHASSYSPASNRAAAHALARILISINPAHVFSAASALPTTNAIRPLIFLLEPDADAKAQNLLQVFEALLALTNLASTDDMTRDAIIRLAWDKIMDDLILSPNTLVQRATVELICNLVASPKGVEKFADGSRRASNRLHILLAMADVEDTATRSAAGGALAMLLEWDMAVDAVLKLERGVEILLGLCGDEHEHVRHRGVVCVRSVVVAPGEIGVRGKEEVKKKGGVEVLKEALKASRLPEVVQMAAETLKVLLV